MGYAWLALFLTLGLFCVMLAFMEIGFRTGVRRMKKTGEKARAGLGAVEGAIFALLGLLIAFTFSGAASRFDERRQLVVEETNAIGTAYLRLDLLAPDRQPELRKLFRRYVDARLSVYARLPDIEAAKADVLKSNAIQGEIWQTSLAACQATNSQPATMLLLPALNQMFDIANARTLIAQIHPPAIIFAMLAVLAIGGALLAGYGMAASRTRSWIHWLAFALVMSATVYVILDIEYPRFGLIRVNAFDTALLDLRQNL